MKILVLGGAKFVGRQIVSSALDREHEVTIFNRGKSNADLFPQVEKLIGDRDGELDQLMNRSWDTVIDVNGYLPRLVRESANLLKEAVENYTFISTISVYADFSRPGVNENSPLAQISEPSTEIIDGDTYGALKVLCERAAEKSFAGRSLIIRPGYVVGPYDHTDRFASWLRRLNRGGEILAPGDESIPLQFIDGRDLAEFVIRRVEAVDSSIYNVSGPAKPFTWGELLNQGSRVFETDVRLTWVSDAFIESQELDESDLPLWTPPEARGVGAANIGKALNAGLAHRPLEDTLRDTLAWDAEYGNPRTGLSLEREAELLKLWHVRRINSATGM